MQLFFWILGYFVSQIIQRGKLLEKLYLWIRICLFRRNIPSDLSKVDFYLRDGSYNSCGRIFCFLSILSGKFLASTNLSKWNGIFQVFQRFKATTCTWGLSELKENCCPDLQTLWNSLTKNWFLLYSQNLKTETP